MRSLRVQLLLSHLLLVLLMGIAVAAAVVSYLSLSQTLDRMLESNLQSMLAAQEMKDALREQEAAMGLLLAGDRPAALLRFEAAWQSFESAYSASLARSTEPGETEAMQDMRRPAAEYRAAALELLRAEGVEDDVRVLRYQMSVAPLRRALIRTADEVLELNATAIARTNARIKDEVQGAAWRSLGVTGATLLLALVLAMRLVRVALTPLASLAEQAGRIGTGEQERRLFVDRKDEIGKLSHAFNDMADRLQEARRIERRRLEAAEQMSDAALESLYDPVVVTDAQGRIVRLNRAAAGLFGGSVKGEGVSRVETLGDRRIVRALRNAIDEDRVSAGEDDTALVPIRVGDAPRTYRLRATPMKDHDGETLGAVAVLEDVTHMRDLDRLKTEFIGVASHELRTPVTSLLLGVQLLQEGAAGPLTAIQSEIVAAQRQDLERLEMLMRDLLDLTRLEAGTTAPRFERVTAGELVEAALRNVKGQAEQKGLSVQAEVVGAPLLRADRTQVVRVLTNLLANAVRHTHGGGHVTVRASEHENQVTFRIEDTGEGIPEDYLDRIFDRFVQVPGATQGGAGLGLSIAQTIVRAHGGEMRVESRLGEGSTFMFTLPSEAPAGDLST
jgi:two-component system, NtrC family, sensor histidine kinase KinB